MNNGKHPSFSQAVTKWTLGRQVSIYLKHRQKPLTGLTVCSISPAVWICRWNGSTHLIPTANISFVRFPPGSDPYDHAEHPLHNTVATGLRRTGRKAPVGIPDGLKDPDAIPVGEILRELVRRKGD